MTPPDDAMGGNTRISEGLIARGDGDAANVEKLLTIADRLMRHAEQGRADGSAFEAFRRAAVLEELVRDRTRDLEATLTLLNEANAATERARRDLSDGIEAIDEGFCLFDAQGILQLCNARFCRPLDDIKPQILPGISFREYVRICSLSSNLALPPGTLPEDWAAARLRRHRSRSVFNVELTGDRWLQVSEQRSRDGGTVVLQTDVTQIIRAERSERGKLLDDQALRIRATLEHLNQGVAIFDAGRRLIGWNWRLAQMLQLPPAMLRQGTAFSALVGQARRAFHFGGDFTWPELAAWVRGRGLRMPLSFELVHGSGVILAAFAQEMPGKGFVISLTDVTRERMAIHAMLRANASLEARVAARTEQLARALVDAERANASRVRFVAAASHDLLQPLSAAKLFVANARDAASAPGVNATLVKAHNALISVESILGALLDISRLEGGGSEVEISPVSLGLLLEQLTEEFAPLAAAKGLSLTIRRCPRVVMSDATYLRRILQNLISNAIRYTAQGRILVGPRRIPGGVRLEVHDTGPGIPPEEQAAIFREFHRVSATASAAEGLGLGLAIVERACVLLQHRLDLRSVPGRGTCFSVDLTDAPPHLRPPRRDPAAHIQSEPGESGERILLLVENDDELRRAMAQLLEGRGVSVLEADSGEAALDLLAEIDIVPDVYLVDLQLGEGMDGTRTLSTLLARHGPRPARIITADRSASARARIGAAGHQVMFKPIDPEELARFVLCAELPG